MQDSARNRNLKRLSNRQEQIMVCLWEKGPLTVTQILSSLNDKLHQNTVSTFVRGLEKIGLIHHSCSLKPYIYYAALKREQYINYMVNDIINTHFGGSKDALIWYIENKDIQNEVSGI